MDNNTKGIILVLLVVTLWVTSSFFISHLFENDNDNDKLLVPFTKPYFITYLNTSSFTIFLLVHRISNRFRHTYQNVHLQNYQVQSAGTLPTIIGGEYLTFMELFVNFGLKFTLLRYFANAFQTASLIYTSVSVSAILTSTSGLFTLLFSVMFGIDSFNYKKISCVLLSIFGIYLVTTSIHNNNNNIGANDQTAVNNQVENNSLYHLLLGNFLALSSAVLYGLYAVLIKLNSHCSSCLVLHTEQQQQEQQEQQEREQEREQEQRLRQQQVYEYQPSPVLLSSILQRNNGNSGHNFQQDQESQTLIVSASTSTSTSATGTQDQGQGHIESNDSENESFTKSSTSYIYLSVHALIEKLKFVFTANFVHYPESRLLPIQIPKAALASLTCTKCDSVIISGTNAESDIHSNRDRNDNYSESHLRGYSQEQLHQDHEYHSGQNGAQSEKSTNPLLFLGCAGLCCLLFYWPILVLLDVLGIESLPTHSAQPINDTTTTSAFDGGSSGFIITVVLLLLNAFMGACLSEFLWLRAVILTSPLKVTLGLSLSIPISILIDVLFKSVVYDSLFYIGTLLITFGFFVL